MESLRRGVCAQVCAGIGGRLQEGTTSRLRIGAGRLQGGTHWPLFQEGISHLHAGTASLQEGISHLRTGHLQEGMIRLRIFPFTISLYALKLGF